MLPRWKRPFRFLINNNKSYIIHINMRKDSVARDQLAAYYFARILDKHLSKMFESDSQSVSYHSVE